MKGEVAKSWMLAFGTWWCLPSRDRPRLARSPSLGRRAVPEGFGVFLRLLPSLGGPARWKVASLEADIANLHSGSFNLPAWLFSQAYSKAFQPRSLSCLANKQPKAQLWNCSFVRPGVAGGSSPPVPHMRKKQNCFSEPLGQKQEGGLGGEKHIFSLKHFFSLSILNHFLSNMFITLITLAFLVLIQGPHPAQPPPSMANQTVCLPCSIWSEPSAPSPGLSYVTRGAESGRF